MKRLQYNELRSPHTGTIRLIRTVGKNKGCIYQFQSVSTYGANINAILDGALETVHYSKFEIIDENDEVVIAPTTDMTNRPISVGEYIVYSVPAGNSSHALEMGKVTNFSKIGSPIVKRIMHNGRKITYDEFKTINDPDRCIKLPIVESTMIMWLMKDFKDLDDD